MAPFPMTLSGTCPRVQGHDILQCQTTRKWYKIELYFTAYVEYVESFIVSYVCYRFIAAYN